MINLIPHAYRQDLVKEYRVRLGIVGLFFVAGAFTTGALFVIPSFFTVALQEKTLQAERAMQEEKTTGNSADMEKILVQADQKLATLAVKYASPSLANMARTIIEGKPTGIKVSSFRYERVQGKDDALVFSGTSATRDMLVSFQEKLKQNPHVTNVQLPISDLANSTNISFTITATLAPIP